jgi:hypothetical protein
MHKSRIYISLLILFLLVVAVTCKKENNSVVPVDYSYFPLKLKSWIIYDIIYRIVDKTSNKDSTYHYQLKEVVDTTFEDNSGRINYRIERYIRKDITSAWAIADVWFECISDYSAQKVEENIRYVKLRFPVEKNKTWNGNLFNTIIAKNYKITSLDIAENINNVAFDSILTVTQENRENLIEKYYFIEKYAKNIGLVQKQEISISDVTSSLSILPIEERIKTAEMYYQNVISYGGF